MEAGKSTFEVVPEKTQFSQSSVISELIDTKYNARYSMIIYAVDGGIFRVKINEVDPKTARFEVPYVLTSDPALQA